MRLLIALWNKFTSMQVICHNEVILCLLSLLLCSCAPPAKEVMEKTTIYEAVPSITIGKTTFLPVPEDQIPHLTAFSKEGIRQAAKANQMFLEAQIPKAEPEEKELLSRFLNTNLILLKLLDQMDSEDMAAFDAKLRERFAFYGPSNTDREMGSVLITGYFQPELLASYNCTAEYNYPLYGIPSDLVQVSLQDFDRNLPAQTLFGRISGNRLLPYYTRGEIEGGALPSNTPVLAWLASPVEGLMLHIQGSGILIFSDGSKRFVHYAANNGHPYRSVGAWLVEQGILTMEQVSWQAIENWARLNPDRFLQASFVNPRYIFFRFEEDGPLGVTGNRLIPMHSVALDRAIYGLGGIFWLTVDDFKDNQPFSTLVLHQDVGSAIKGPHRVDLYVGEGKKAGDTAGRLKNSGRLLLLLVKDDNRT
ncbi:MAG: MltA domain-containing protein [Dissulfuribacterales bacterium]